MIDWSCATSTEKNIMINAAVGFDKSNSLDVLLSGRQVPADVDVLSIDIDGNDYHAWAAINSLRPKLVVIEFNPTIANAVRFIQEKAYRHHAGCQCRCSN